METFNRRHKGRARKCKHVKCLSRNDRILLFLSVKITYYQSPSIDKRLSEDGAKKLRTRMTSLFPCRRTKKMICVSPMRKVSASDRTSFSWLHRDSKDDSEEIFVVSKLPSTSLTILMTQPSLKRVQKFFKKLRQQPKTCASNSSTS